MLVLSRKVDECVMIGDDIEIMVVGLEGDQVKLGINAPKSIPIHRKEVYEEIQRENIEAAQSSGDETKSVAKFIQQKETESEESSKSPSSSNPTGEATSSEANS